MWGGCCGLGLRGSLTVTGPPGLPGEPSLLLILTCEETEVELLIPGGSVRKYGWGLQLGVTRAGWRAVPEGQGEGQVAEDHG